MNTLIKIAGASILTGGLVLGAMTYWNGSDTVQTAKETISEYAEKINIFKSNEERLVAKINELKAEKRSLEEQLNQQGLDVEKIAELERQLTEANAQIAELEEQLANANNNGETMAERIDALTAELERANADAAALQEVLDANQTDAEPMTQEEIDALINESEVSNEPVEEPTEPETNEPVHVVYKERDPELEVLPGITIRTTGYGIRVSNNTGSYITVREFPAGPTSTIENGRYRDLSSNARSITIFDENGTIIATSDIIR